MPVEPMTPDEVARAARIIAYFAVDADPDGRAMCLNQLCKENPLLHALVVDEISKIHRHRRFIGYAFLLGMSLVFCAITYFSRHR